MNPPCAESFIAPIVDCLQLGGQELLKRFGAAQTISRKTDKSNIVSEADFAAEQVLIGFVQKHFPDHSILSEEIGYLPGSSEFTWIIDPLDGTANFASHIPWFGVIIGLVRGGSPLAGGMFLPVLDKLYSGQRKMGAACNGAAVSLSPALKLEDTLCAIGIDCTPDTDTQLRQTKEIAALAQQVRNLRCTNSLMDQSLLLDGCLGGCINRSTKLWDIAAFCLLLEEAGGIGTDPAGNPIDFAVTANCVGRATPIVAGTAAIHPQLLEAISEPG